MRNSLIKKSITAAGIAATLAPLAARAEEYSTDYTYSTTDTAAAGGVVAVLFVIWGLVLLFALAFFIFWIVMLVDALKRTNWNDDNQKTMWLVILIVGLLVGLGGIAAIVYYFAVKRALDKPKAAPASTTTTTQK